VGRLRQLRADVRIPAAAAPDGPSTVGAILCRGWRSRRLKRCRFAAAGGVGDRGRRALCRQGRSAAFALASGRLARALREAPSGHRRRSTAWGAAVEGGFFGRRPVRRRLGASGDPVPYAVPSGRRVTCGGNCRAVHRCAESSWPSGAGPPTPSRGNPTRESHRTRSSGGWPVRRFGSDFAFSTRTQPFPHFPYRGYAQGAGLVHHVSHIIVISDNVSQVQLRRAFRSASRSLPDASWRWPEVAATNAFFVRKRISR
jgi:hypothetical protein